MKPNKGGFGSTSETAAVNIRRIRGEKGLRLEDLAKATTDNGWTLHASAISNMERMQRRIDVDDLTALAVALEVSPATLLTPQEGHILTGTFEDTPTEDSTVWVRGKINTLKQEETLAYWTAAKVKKEHELATLDTEYRPSGSPILYKMLAAQYAEIEADLEKIRARLGE